MYIRKQLFAIRHPLIVMVLFLACNDRQDGGNDSVETNCNNLEAGQKGFIQLTKQDEPGEPLVIY